MDPENVASDLDIDFDAQLSDIDSDNEASDGRAHFISFSLWIFFQPFICLCVTMKQIKEECIKKLQKEKKKKASKQFCLLISFLKLYTH